MSAAAGLWCRGTAAVLALALGLGGQPRLWTTRTVWFSLAGLAGPVLGGSLLLCTIGRRAEHLHLSKKHA